MIDIGNMSIRLAAGRKTNKMAYYRKRKYKKRRYKKRKGGSNNLFGL